jgi:hypothetical protein
LEVTVLDHEGKPLPEVRVMTWPNVRYAEWGATILMSDCYNSSDYYRGGKQTYRERPVMDFQGVSDSAGVAVLANLPADVTELAVEHSRFALPAVGNAMGGKNRNASFKLLAGQTNHISIRLEPRNQSPIRHY